MFLFYQLFKYAKTILISGALQNQATCWIWPMGYSLLSSLLYPWYVRSSFFFVELSRVPNNLVDSALSNWKETFFNDIWFLLTAQNSDTLIKSLNFSWQYTYLYRFSRILYSFLLGYIQRNKVCNQELAENALFEDDAHFIRYDSLLLRN